MSLLGKTGYHRFHKLHAVSAADARLNIIELANDVDRRAAGDLSCNVVITLPHESYSAPNATIRCQAHRTHVRRWSLRIPFPEPALAPKSPLKKRERSIESTPNHSRRCRQARDFPST